MNIAPAPGTSAGALGVGDGQQFLGVRTPGLGVVETGEHAGQFGDPLLLAEVRTPLAWITRPPVATLSTTRWVSATPRPAAGA
ncbi:hypothetical protein NJ76_00975 [Rhodococcus sp. IITR03]|nr:hypothetical protein NJ76_00975 [Rhodococcus sp. IITR03]